MFYKLWRCLFRGFEVVVIVCVAVFVWLCLTHACVVSVNGYVVNVVRYMNAACEAHPYGGQVGSLYE